MIFINYDIGCHIKVMSQKTYWRFPINLEKNISADFKLLLYFSNRYKLKKKYDQCSAFAISYSRDLKQNG